MSTDEPGYEEEIADKELDSSDDGKEAPMTYKEKAKANGIKYTVTDVPPLPLALMLGVQHYLTMLGTYVALNVPCRGGRRLLFGSPVRLFSCRSVCLLPHIRVFFRVRTTFFVLFLDRSDGAHPLDSLPCHGSQWSADG
jgi:hypothetical protein